MLFYQISFVFRLQISSPTYGIFEFIPFADSFFKNFHSFGVRQPHKIIIHHKPQSFNQFLIIHFGQEVEIIHAVIECPADAVLNKVLCQLHVFFYFVECHFGFNHPELRQVTRCVGIFSAECWSECINCSQRHSGKFAFKLSRNGEIGRFAKEIVAVIHFSILGQLDIFQVKRSNLKHLSGTFGIRSSDNGRVEIEKSTVVKEFMNSNGHVVTNAEHSSKRIGTGAQMRYFT